MGLGERKEFEKVAIGTVSDGVFVFVCVCVFFFNFECKWKGGLERESKEERIRIE